MAIYNGRILMRKGNEADFDPSKLMSGEWAVSLDAGIVRICLEAGKVIRMATYEAFEEDVKQIEAILLECQSIEEAVRRINTEVSEKLNACAEYVQQAKGYSEQAKTSEANAKSYMQSAKTSEENAKVSETNAKASENSAKEYENNAKLTEERAREVFESIPEDYSTISNDLYELAIKETASGEEIHVNDSSNLKLREFALYGKAKQNTTQGNQLFNYDAWKTIATSNGTSVFENNGVTITATSNDAFTLYEASHFPSDAYVEVSEGETITLSWEEDTNKYGRVFIFPNGEHNGVVNTNNNKNKKLSYTVPSGVTFITFRFGVDSAGDTISYKNIMINKGSEPLPYEPYTNGASPNPQYPQPIEVSGESGSVVVKSCGKNLWNPLSKATNTNGDERYGIYLSRGTYTVTNNTNSYLYYREYDSKTTLMVDKGKQQTLTFDKETIWWVMGYLEDIQIEKGNVVTPYEPYKETLATIPTENGLAGIKVTEKGNYTDSNGQQWICDEIVKYADGSGEYVKRVEKYTVTGNENINKSSLQTVDRYLITLPINSNDTTASLHNNHILCTKGVATVLLMDTSIGKCGFDTNISNVRFAFNYGAYGTTTIDDFKADMIGVDIYYPLSTPIHTQLTAEEIAEIEKLQTFYPITNISNDFDCGMSVTYYCDSKNYINNQLAIMKQEQEEAMANILSLMPTEVQAMMIENDTNDLLKESEI